MYKPSACAAVENFRHVMVFKLPSQGRNVLLKFKPGFQLEARQGSSLKRMGLMSVFTGEAPAGELDFSTNIQTYDCVLNSMGR